MNGTNEQREQFQATAFVCLGRADYDKTPFSVWILDKRNLDKIIDWYCPGWYRDFVNKQGEEDFVPYYLHYDWLMELKTKDLLQPTKELLAKVMPQMIFEQNANLNWIFTAEKLLKEKITSEEHIWYLFEKEANIHYSGRYLKIEEGVSQEQTGWITLFRQYASEGRLERFQVIKESLLASNRNFNKVLSGWFAQLFTEMEPTR